MARTVAIIGAGQIGFAAARAFADAGWSVTVYARSEPSWHDPKVAQFSAYIAGEHAAPAAEVAVDTIAFDAQDIDRYDPERVSRLIAISSASVYRDTQGRTLDEAAQNGFPDFPEPIAEEQATVDPGPETYSTRKVRMEKRAEELFGDRATIMRPCAIHGPYSRHPREWWFVKRMLDGREHIPLAVGGRSRFQTTAVATIGKFALHAAENALAGIFNIADADAPSVLEIGEAIAMILHREAEFHPSEQFPGTVGRTPWSIPAPFTVDGSKAQSKGFGEAQPYLQVAGPAIDWLRDLNPADWRTAFPQLAAYPWDLFDYNAEDQYFTALD